MQKNTNMTLKLTVLAALIGGVMSSSAATMFIQNVSDGPGDKLYALNNNTLMNGGIVTMGYFSSTVAVGDISTIQGLLANLASFTVVTTVVPGSAGPTFTAPGYAEGSNVNGVAVPGGNILAGNPLIGRSVYQIVTDAVALTGVGGATIANQFAVIGFGTLVGDEPSPQAITGNISIGGSVVLSGGAGTFTAGTTYPGGEGVFKTLKMAVVPEPSAALLGALGVLGLLRRRRN
jgi:MYXO-CTERM domain-containing protein